MAIVLATLLGPILAIQAQKALERSREGQSRKLWVFHTLMATRAARVSPEHVQALNTIELVFYGQRPLGVRRRRKSEQQVIDAWREHLDHLNTRVDSEGLQLWSTKGEELFVNLLFAMALDVGYTFDRVQLKRGVYSPIAHSDLEEQQNRIRELAVQLLKGDAKLKVEMEVSELPR